jgi:isopenicillin N synthase-like dioxygenase
MDDFDNTLRGPVGALAAQRVAVEDIPVIDFGPFVWGDAEARRDVAGSIGEACRNIGFFYVTNHGVPWATVQRFFGLCAEVFAQPIETKRLIAIEQSSCHRGWFSMGAENLDPAKQTGDGDLKEGIKIGQDLPLNHVYVANGVALHGPNQWPAEPADFTPTARELIGLLTNLGRQLMSALALALGLDERFFDDRLTLPMCTLGPLHYPPQRGQVTEAQIGAGAHTDFGCITLLAQHEVAGLQVRNAEGTWISAPPIDGSFVVNIGDMMARWSNDVFCSTVHRVVNTSGEERYSLPFFFDPNYDADVSCLPTCATADRPARYAPTSGLAHLQEKINESFAYRDTVQPA